MKSGCDSPKSGCDFAESGCGFREPLRGKSSKSFQILQIFFFSTCNCHIISHIIHGQFVVIRVFICLICSDLFDLTSSTLLHLGKASELALRSTSAAPCRPLAALRRYIIYVLYIIYICLLLRLTLLWSRDVGVAPASRCDFALTVWRVCAGRRYCAQQESVSLVQRTHFAGLTRGTDPERGAFSSPARWCRRWWFGSCPCP